MTAKRAMSEEKKHDLRIKKMWRTFRGILRNGSEEPSLPI